MVEVVIPAGMKPWAGGDSAPADWDEWCKVMFRDRTIRLLLKRELVAAWRWGEKTAWYDIIAYTPRADVADSQPHTNTIADSGAGGRCQQSERERVARIIERAIEDANSSAITGDCGENYRHAEMAADAILATLRAVPDNQSATDAADLKRNATSQSGLPHRAGEVLRLREALQKIADQDWWSAVDESDEVDGRCAEIARAALAQAVGGEGL